MGRRGPVPQPTALRIIKGNPSKRPLNRNEPKPRPIAPSRPEWLLPEAKREWSRIMPELERLGLLTIIDRAALAGYCQEWARYVEAERALIQEGTTFTTPSGYIQQRPEVAIAKKSLQLVRAFCAEFGLTPSSRSRMSVREVPDDDMDLD